MALRKDARRGGVLVRYVCEAVAIAQLGVYLVFIVSLSVYAVIAGGIASAAPLFRAAIGSLTAYFSREDTSNATRALSGRNAKRSEAHSLVDYPPAILRIYDATLLYNNTVAWGVRPRDLQAHFDASITAHHLDIGVGSGYLPSHCTVLQQLVAKQQGRSSINAVRLALWDLNAAPLQYASARVSKSCTQQGRVPSALKISTRTADVLNADDIASFARHTTDKPFTSISMFYLFHCVPNPRSRDGRNLGTQGASTEKFYLALANMRTVAAKGATITGATILTPNDPAVQSACNPLQYAIGRSMMDLYQNRFRHFYNHHDTLDNLRAAAERAGLAVESLYAHGFVAFFVFRNV